MRISRHLQLPQTGGLVHKFWRAHNKAYLLEDNAVKETYLKNAFYALKHKSIGGKVALHAFCVMSNHAHECISYKEKSRDLSHFMRIAHGRFGQLFNKRFNRQGAVAYDRPKTPLIESDFFHQMRVHFYIEANPLRARMVKNLKLYRYSSYRFYAWGLTDEFTDEITMPDWYLALGKTPKQRQSKYRSLFDQYINGFSIRSSEFTHSYFIGDPGWVFFKNLSLKNHVATIKVKDPPS